MTLVFLPVKYVAYFNVSFTGETAYERFISIILSLKLRERSVKVNRSLSWRYGLKVG